MTQQLFKKFDDFMENLNDDPTEKQIKDKIDSLVYSGSPALRTISSRYSLFKSYVRKNYDGLSDDFLKTIKPPDEIIKHLLNEDMERRQAKTNFNFSDKDVDKILSLIDSDNILDLGIYLQFISGRRASEIYQHKDDHDLIKLERIKNKPELVKFSSLHKKNNDEKREIVMLVPDTIDSKTFKEKYTQLQKNFDIKTQDYINRINRRLKELFKNKKDMSSHKLRGMYAVYMFNEHNPQDMNINGFITDILNHDSPDSSLNYSNYVYKKTPVVKIERKIKKKSN